MSVAAWDDFPVLDHVPSDYDVFEVPDNGFQLVILWEIGPEFGFRVARTEPGNILVEIKDPQSGVTHTHSEPRSEADFDTIDEFVNEYLDEAGIPPRPRGFLWYCHTPSTLRDAESPMDFLGGEVTGQWLGPTGADTRKAARYTVPQYFAAS